MGVFTTDYHCVNTATLHYNNMSDINTFVRACGNNNIDTVRQLINKVDVNGRDGGWTGLMTAMFCNYQDFAMSRNNQDIVRMLLDHPNIELSRTSSLKKTALHMSCQNNNTGCVRLFLAHNNCTPKIVNKKDCEGKTAEMLASERGHHECARIVREYLDTYGQFSSPNA